MVSITANAGAMARIESNGAGLEYVVRSDGVPVLLLHGFTSSYRGTWERTEWADLLIEHGFKTIGLDVRGHGHSDKPHETAAYATSLLVRDVLTLLASLHLDRAHVF